MRAASPLITLLLLVGCNKGERRDEASPPVSNGPAAETNIAALPPAQKVEEVGALPPASDPLRFAGFWASDAKSCDFRVWHFTPTSLTTPAGSSCRFEKVSQVAGGYDIQATCSAEGPPAKDEITIRFAESAKAMLFDSKTIASTGLIYCGRPT